MPEHILQSVGKIAGIAGVSLGVFLMLFQEVIRKNIFPMLSDDEAYRLIRQFMFLTFGIALAGIASWTYVTAVAAQGGGAGHKARKLLEPASDVSGVWTAEVKYAWGDTHKETFTFEVNRHELSGIATYVTGPSAITDGVVDGDQLVFHTASYTELNGQRYQEKHTYKGKIVGDTIEFVLQTDSGYTAVLPIKFVAHRRPA